MHDSIEDASLEPERYWSEQMKRLLFASAFLGLTFVVAPSAFGDTFNVYSFFLTVDEHGHTTPPADSVMVTVSLDTSTDTSATVTFTGENGYFLDDVFFNVSGDFSVGTITGTSTPTQTYTATPNNSLDSYGTMSEEVTPNGGHPSSTITIPLTALAGNTWANAFDVLTRTCPSNGSVPSCVGGFGVPSPDVGGGYNAANYAQGFDADAKIGTSASSAASDQEDLAGFAVPEPASLLLFGSVVLLLATLVRRKSSARAQVLLTRFGRGMTVNRHPANQGTTQ
jgi:hypothetical protein